MPTFFTNEEYLTGAFGRGVIGLEDEALGGGMGCKGGKAGPGAAAGPEPRGASFRGVGGFDGGDGGLVL